MKTKLLYITPIIIIVFISVLLYWNHLEYVSATKHETDRWAVIRDVDGNVLAVETTSEDVWTQLAQLNQNGTRMWVGGVVERYDNKWGFRFKPETIIIAQYTIEGAQATIRFISEDIDYWINFGITYVGSKVVKTHS
jgi:hypothetical protein